MNTEEARARLAAAHGLPDDGVELVPVTASGDKVLDRPLAEIGGKALWTKELDAWLLSLEICWVEDRPLAMGAMPNVQQVSYASPGYFAALGIPLVEGHAFEAPDPARASLEVVITQALARRYWGDAPAVGRRLRLSLPSGAWFTVVGVTGDVRGDGLDHPPDETVYLPLVTAPGPAGADGGAGPARWTPRERSSAATRRSAIPTASSPLLTGPSRTTLP